MVRVVLAAETGWSNSGDDLMVRGTIEALRQLDSQTSISVISPNAWQVREFVGPDVEVTESPLLSLDEAAGGVGAAMSWGQRRAVARTLRAGLDGSSTSPEPILQTIAAVREADALVFAGGGYLTDRWPLTVRNARFIGEAARRFGRPYVLYGHSIWPLRDRRQRRDVRTLLSGAAGIAVREPASLAEAGSLAGGRPVDLVGDPALALAEVRVHPGEGDGFVVNLRNTGGDDPGVRAIVAGAVEDVAAAHGLELRFIEAGLAPYSDDAAANSGLDAMVSTNVRRGPAIAHVVGRIDLPPARIVVGVSYHVCLVSLAKGIPAVGLALSSYGAHKLGGLFALFDRPQWVWTPDRGRDALARTASEALADGGAQGMRTTAAELAERQRQWLARSVLAI